MDTTQFQGVTVPSIIQSLKPVKNQQNYREIKTPLSALRYSITESAWLHKDGFFVISAVEHASDGEAIDKGAEYHLSFSKQTASGPVRCDMNETIQLISDFGFEGSKEDNHVPHGKVRNFWRPVNENLIGLECACVDDEPAIREDKGDYVWRPA